MIRLDTLTNKGNNQSSSSRRYSKNSYRWSRRSKLLLIGIGFLSVTIFFMVLFFGIHMYSLSKEKEFLRIDFLRSEKELEELKPSLQQLREDLKRLVENRIPRLRSLEYDKVIQLDIGYVKNIVFTLIKNGHNKHYEYKLVMQNTTPFVIWPDLRIYFFNELGIQIGIAKIGAGKNSLSPEGKHSLEAGEIRSYSSKINLVELMEDETPAYFLVRVREDGMVDLPFDKSSS